MADRTITADLIGRDRSMSAAFDKAGKSAEKNGALIGKVGKVIGTGLKVGAVAAGGGLLALGGFIAQGVKDAGSYQTVLKKTAAVLKSTGNVAGTSVKGIQDQAAALETMSGVDEELIINSQNVLATFTGIRNVGKNKIFDQATKSALDISTALGSDLQGASIQVGKALNDPIKGVGALSKVGVSFTAQQKEQIKTMVKNGDTMGAQKIILGELNKEFGGAAKAAGSGFEGALARAQDALSDTGRTIGQMILPYVTRLAEWFAVKFPPAFAQAQVAVTAFVAAFQGKNVTGDGFIAKAATAGALAKTTFEALRGAVETVITVVQSPAFPYFAKTVGVITAAVLVYSATMRAIAVVTGVWTAAQAALNVVLTLNPIGLVVVAIAALTAGIIYAYKHSETFRAVFLTVFKSVGNIVLGTVSKIIGAFEGLFGVLGHLPGKAGSAFRSAANAARGARQTVDGLRASLNNIPTHKQVNIGVHTTFYQTGKAPGSYGNGLGVIAPRASGGPVSNGTTYLVGEEGPELFTAPFSGSIIPHQRMKHAPGFVKHARKKGKPTHIPKSIKHAPAHGGSGGSGGGSGGGGGEGNTYITINVRGSVIATRNELKRDVIDALNKATAGGPKIKRSVIER
jgi:hypothetical protein